VESVDDFLRWLESVRKRTVLVAERIPDEHLERAPAPGRFTPADIVRHIAATERWMWAENALGRPSRYPGHGPELAAGKSDVLALLDRLHRESVAIFASLGPEQLSAKVTTVGRIDITVWKWLRLMIEHEIHHRGQLYEMLGGWGVETPPLYGLTEPEVAARSESLAARGRNAVARAQGAREVTSRNDDESWWFHGEEK
jgi:uncharacterized damage-inducible protein DinB